MTTGGPAGTPPSGWAAETASQPGASGPRLALVCGLMLGVIALTITLPDTQSARSFATAFTALGLIAAVWAARVPRRFMLTVSIVVSLCAAVSIVGLASGGSFTTANAIIVTMLVVAVPVAILAGLRNERTVNLQTVFGAISIYLVLGLAFGYLITIAARLTTHPYFAQGTDGTLSQRVYFSYVTLATLGYGDLTPATGIGRLLAVLESILGSLYLVTAVSLVVTRIGGPRRRD